MTGNDWQIVGDAARLRAAGLFVIEGRTVLARALASPVDGGIWRSRIEVVLSTPAAAAALHLHDLVPDRLEMRSPADMQAVTGFNFHRGVVALVRRPPAVPLDTFLSQLDTARPLVACEHLVDVDNVGSIFRNAQGLGAAGVVLDGRSADPLYRKAVRTSMGAVLELPWAACAGTIPWGMLRAAGYRLVGLTPAHDAMPLREALEGPAGGVVALVAGNEGSGLSAEALAACDVRARIPMRNGADSLNVATAVALALYEAGRQTR